MRQHMARYLAEQQSLMRRGYYASLSRSQRRANRLSQDGEGQRREASPELQLLASPLISSEGSVGATGSPLVSPGASEADSDVVMTSWEPAPKKARPVAKRPSTEAEERPTVRRPPTDAEEREAEAKRPSTEAEERPTVRRPPTDAEEREAEEKRVAEWRRRIALEAAKEALRQRQVWEDARALAKSLKATQEAEQAAEEAKEKARREAEEHHRTCVLEKVAAELREKERRRAEEKSREEEARRGAEEEERPRQKKSGRSDYVGRKRRRRACGSLPLRHQSPKTVARPRRTRRRRSCGSDDRGPRKRRGSPKEDGGPKPRPSNSGRERTPRCSSSNTSGRDHKAR
ncbi:eukaryotic translation initiation factor 4 gamma-like [Drosophila obscura]|uniref:eukaryotic translation initiation factor 4 gamma-like n=1 Tax=Drosophila obscura TaxID=7282 RepID=UPI001BB216B8|nr:eukaryotic translation initiation factor 4 gamma-like [Drosophila obscura]